MQPPATDPTDPVVPASSIPLRAGRVWACTLLAATLAGVGAWLGGEGNLRRFVPAVRMVMVMGTSTNMPTFEEKVKAERRNASLGNGILGGALGLALGLAGGLARGSIRSAAVAGLAGAVLGLGAGVGASELALPVYFRQLDKGAEDLSKDVLFPLMIHAACWSFMGAAAGVALAFGAGADRSRILSAAVAGLIGAAIGAVAYEMIGALAFPGDKTTDPIAAEWAPRLIAKLSVALLAAVFAAFALLSPGRPARK